MPLSLYEFGEFELDRDRYELRRNGQVIKIERIPMDLLILLAEKDGAVVTRQEIIERLWGKDVFVDTEHGINTAIRKIRQALKDDPERPRYVQTVTGKGYRFMGLGNGNGHAILVNPLPRVALRSGSSKRLRLAGFGLLGLLILGAALIGRNTQRWRNWIFASHTNPPVQALAVLPLANMSDDPGQEYFADGMTEALITELGRVSSPRVISRQSVMQYKGSKKPLPEIARELNVDAVLEGAVERAGDRVRVTVHLERVSPESQVWASEYDRSLRDVLALQEEIARSITDEIQVKLTREQRSRLTSARPVDPEVHENYLRGLYFTSHSYASEATVLAAIRCFKQAIEGDPSYAPAYSGLAEAYMYLGHPSVGGHSPKETLPLAKAAALKAIELDPALGEAHISLAQILEHMGHSWPEVEREFQVGLKLSPNYAEGYDEYGVYLQFMGRFDEAIAQTKYAITLDPLYPDHRTRLGQIAFNSHRYDDAIREWQSIGEASWGWRNLPVAYEMKGMSPEAIAAAEDLLRRDGRAIRDLSLLARLYGEAGRTKEAERLIEEIRQQSKVSYLAPSFMADAYVGLGRKDEALTWLERAYDDDDEMMPFLKVSPLWDSLRPEPRFQALLRRMNFPP